MENRNYRVLVYGYGNPGRRDDGLGPALAEQVEDFIKVNGIGWISVDSNYQLNIEDAYTIRDYDLVFFADATFEDIADFMVTRVYPDEKVSFSMHSVSPGYVLNLCETLYGKHPAVYLYHLKGFEFELKEGLSEPARKVLKLAYEHLINLITQHDLYYFQDQEIVTEGFKIN